MADRLSWLDAFERAARFSWQLDLNPVIDSYFAARMHDAHDSCFSNHIAPAVSGQNCFQEPGLEVINLEAGVTQTCHLNDRVRSYPQKCSFRQGQEVDAVSCDVLSEVPGLHRETFLLKLDEQFCMDQMHLPQVGLRRITSNS
jgi:hypothetical protein